MIDKGTLVAFKIDAVNYDLVGEVKNISTSTCVVINDCNTYYIPEDNVSAFYREEDGKWINLN